MPLNKIVNVRFTQTFLQSAANRLQDSELSSISAILAADPTCGDENEEIQHLRKLSWPSQQANLPDLLVWYLAYPEVPHIEVIALTEITDAQDSLEVHRVAWSVFRIGMLLRSMYRIYATLRDYFDFPDLTGLG